MELDELTELRDRLRAFAEDRDWAQFHTPKNLACSVCVEAAELLELFQWSDANDRTALPADLKAKAAEEVADVLFYLVMLSDKLDVDLGAALEAKLAKNAAKYPVELSRGKSTKYTELKP